MKFGQGTQLNLLSTIMIINKHQIIDNFFVFALIVFSSNASFISSDEIYISLFFLFTLGYAIKKRIFQFSSKQLFSILFLVIFIIGYYYVANSSINIVTWVGWLIKIILAILIVRINKSQFIDNFIKIVCFLTIVSFFGYVLQLLVPDLLFKFNNLFGMDSRGNSNSLFFNFTRVHPMRNSGCMWEPGAFAALLIIALLLLQFYSSEKKSREKIIISLGLLTTISTTGYLLLGLILLFNFLNNYKGRVKVIGLAIFFPFGMYLFYNSQVLSGKISAQLEGIEEEADKASKNPDYFVGVTRFTSVIIDLPTFLERPLLGYGVDIQTTGKNSLYKIYGANVIRSSGLFYLLLVFGVLGLVIYLGLLYRNLQHFSKNHLITIFTTLCILFIIFSNPMEFSPIILILFCVKRSKQNAGTNHFNKKIVQF